MSDLVVLLKAVIPLEVCVHGFIFCEGGCWCLSYLVGGARALKRVGTSLHLQLQTSQDGNTEVRNIFFGRNRLGACHLVTHTCK